jgi:hypothetical protein
MASTEAQRERLRIVSSLELPTRPLILAWRYFWRALTHRFTLIFTREVVAATALLGTVVAVFWPMLIGVGVYAESDTFTYFYPVFALLHASLRARSARSTRRRFSRLGCFRRSKDSCNCASST